MCEDPSEHLTVFNPRLVSRNNGMQRGACNSSVVSALTCFLWEDPLPGGLYQFHWKPLFLLIAGAQDQGQVCYRVTAERLELIREVNRASVNTQGC